MSHKVKWKPWHKLSRAEKLHRLLTVHGTLQKWAPRLSRTYQRMILKEGL